MPAKHLPASAANLKQLMMKYFMDMHAQARGGKFTVWIAIIVPIELLPENHAAACAAKGVGGDQCARAEAMGYSADLCSYARIDIGTAFSKRSGSPVNGMPRPDLLISNNNNCSLLSKWFDVHRREWSVPHFVLDVPFCYGPQTEADTDYIVHQFKELIVLIEDMTGQEWDEEKTREAVRLSNEANVHWKRFLDTAARTPAPVTAFDSFLHMAPYITAYRGTPQLVDHFKLLADEAEAQAAAGRAPVPHERFRLLWDNIAPWHQLRAMSTRLAALGANIVQATYTSCLGTVEGEVNRFDYDASQPLRTLARIQNSSVCPYGLALRDRAMSGIVERFNPHGIVFASNRSCKVYSLMQMDLERRMRERFGIPTVMIDVDHADARKYSEEKAFTAIEAMLEEISL